MEPGDALALDTETLSLDHIQHAVALDALKTLKAHEREALYLRGLGCRYHEIAHRLRQHRRHRRIREGCRALRRAAHRPGERACRDPATTGAKAALQPLTALMNLVTYHGRAVAIADVDRFHLALHIDELSAAHPLKRFVCFLPLYARDVLIGELVGDPCCYRAVSGERYARAALIPAREFQTFAYRSDRQFATQFGVPIEQIARRRHDLTLCPLRGGAQSRRRG